MNTGIVSWGGYLPRPRLERKSIVDANGWANGALVARARGTRAFCNWDEDALTMGVEAARSCLARIAAHPERLIFASTTPPFQDRSSAVLAAAVLRLPAQVRGLDHGGSQRAGSSALLDALHGAENTLVIAADTRHASPGTVQELAYGDGAASMLVGSGEVVARFLGGVSRGEDFVDHFRATGSNHELHWEERWVRDEGIGKFIPQTINALLQRVGVEAASVRHFIFPTVMAKLADGSAPGTFAQLANAYSHRHGVKSEDLKRAMAHVSWKSHQNGTKSPKAHMCKAVTMETILSAPMVAEPLGLFDCCGVSDGAAAAIVTTPEIARSLGKKDLITIKALQLALSDGEEMQTNAWDGSYVKTTRVAARRAYAEAGIRDPRQEVSMTEVHDCFSVTELITMEDLGLSDDGRAVYDILDGQYDATGKIPCQIDGGLKCFGHPIGASGLRMVYENYLQLQARAGERQLKNPRLGLTHNLGGTPYNNVACISIIGHLND